MQQKNQQLLAQFAKLAQGEISQEEASEFLDNYQSENSAFLKPLNFKDQEEGKDEKGGKVNLLQLMTEKYQKPDLNNQFLYEKLHEEILDFRQGVVEVQEELRPLQEKIIQKVLGIVQKIQPGSDISIYGSHETKLCLPWSDIDISVKLEEQEQVNYSLLQKL